MSNSIFNQINHSNVLSWNRDFCSMELNRNTGKLTLKVQKLNIFQRILRYCFGAYNNTVWTQKKIDQYITTYSEQTKKISKLINGLQRCGKNLNDSSSPRDNPRDEDESIDIDNDIQDREGSEVEVITPIISEVDPDLKTRYGPAIPINYKDPIIKEFQNFQDLVYEKNISNETLAEKLNEIVYISRIQEFAAMTVDVKSRKKFLRFLPKTDLVKPYITGLIHHESTMNTRDPNYLPTPERIDKVINFVKDTLPKTSAVLCMTLKSELKSLQSYKEYLIQEKKRLEESLIKTSIESIFDEKLYLEKVQKFHPSLKWKHLMAIHSTGGLGLRHIESPIRGSKELNEGIVNGDAIYLSAGVPGILCKLLQEKKIVCGWILPSNFFEDESMKDFSDDRSKNVSYVQKYFAEIINFLSEDDKRLLTTEYERAIWNFLMGSILVMDNMVDVKSPKEKFIAKRVEMLANSSTFLIIHKKGTPHSFNHSGYYYLGTFSSKDISRKRIKKMITIQKESLEKAWKVTREENFTEQLISIDHSAVLSAHNQILKAIKEITGIKD